MMNRIDEYFRARYTLSNKYGVDSRFEITARKARAYEDELMVIELRYKEIAEQFPNCCVYFDYEFFLANAPDDMTFDEFLNEHKFPDQIKIKYRSVPKFFAPKTAREKMIFPVTDAYLEAMDALRAEYFSKEKMEDELTAKEAREYQNKANKIAKKTLKQKRNPFEPSMLYKEFLKNAPDDQTFLEWQLEKNYISRTDFEKTIQERLNSPYRRPESLCILETTIAGFAHYDGEKIFKKLDTGKKLTLKAEPQNKYDENAVEVFWQEHKLGYIPKRDNSKIADLLRNTDIPVSAEVIATHPDKHPQQQVNIRLFAPRTQKVKDRIGYDRLELKNVAVVENNIFNRIGRFLKGMLTN